MIITKENFRQYKIGAKAENLFIMQYNGINVPDFFCADISSAKEAADYAAQAYTESDLFSVRSSSSAEDSENASFAGQFRTYLGVERKDIERYIEKTAQPIETKGFREYCLKNKISAEEIQITVIVQKMISADISGVVFTANPQGLLNEIVIVAGNGTGDNVVEDKTDTTTYYYNTTDRQYYYEKKEDSPLLDNILLEEIISVSEKIREIFGHECDIEFAVKDKVLYILQARPITTLTQSSSPVILDNSNIVESYPGITLPLTQSFIKDAYYCVFRSVLLRLTHEKDTVARADGILSSMVDACNGRVYYRISNWYDIIMFLPFSKKIIPVWQEMLGVKTKTVTAHSDIKPGFITHAKVTLSFFKLIIKCPELMEELDRYFSDILEKFRSVNISAASDAEILEHYQNIKNMVSEKWDITLVNDMYSFIYTGLLKAYLKAKKVPDTEEAANRYISGLNGLESMKPVNTLIELAETAKKENWIDRLRKISSNEDFYRFVSEEKDSFSDKLTEYIEQYGDRNVNELKLESKTFRTDPVLLISSVLEYAENGTGSFSAAREEKKETPKGLTGSLAKRAALGIKNRERSRLHRSRLYGMMRTMMLQIGESLAEKGKLSCREDIFFLTYEQVEKAVRSGENMMKTVSAVRKKYEMFERLPAYSRLVFTEDVFDKNPSSVVEMQFSTDGNVFVGVPCSKGCAEGEVLVITDPSEKADTAGKIIAAKMTDPGWVFLIAGAKGIVTEKGSLLSHTAIISRELGKPAVVGIDNITRILKNGDHIRIDGGTGEVQITYQREK